MEENISARSERERCREIYAIAEKHPEARELVTEYIEGGKSAAEFGRAVLDKKQAAPVIRTAGPIFRDKEIKGYSITRAISGIIQNGSLSGLEKEVNAEMERQAGKSARGFFVPDEIFTRALTAATPTAAAELVGTQHMAGAFVDLLRDAQVCVQAGATLMDGLQQNISIPKQTGAATAQWVGESSNASASYLATTAITLEPRTVSANTIYTRKLLLQSLPSIENLVVKDFAQIIGNAIDKAALMGSGAPATVPTGILSTSGIGAVDCGGVMPDYADLLGLFSDVHSENVDGSMSFVMNSKMAACLMQRYPNTTGGDTPLVKRVGNGFECIGFPAFVTNAMPNTFTSAEASTGGALTAIIFGKFSDLILASWSGTDILIDPYTYSTKGDVVVVAFRDVDVGVRHAESFSATQNAATA